MFRALYFNDLPHNLAPSLHISLRSLVWVFYGAILSGWLRRITKVWFILIGASTLLVLQHHVVDIAGGFVMGWLIAVLIPDPRQAGTRNPSPRLARRYGTGALACALLSFIWLGFIWPAVALGIMAAAYGSGLSRLLGKENGTLSPSVEWCLLPVILVAGLIQRKWMKRTPALHEISPGVWFGRKPNPREAVALISEGELAVLDLTAESNAPALFREKAVYQNLPLLDLVPPKPEHITAALEFIAEHQAQRRVFIHCQLGLQRSAIVAAHWLVACGSVRDLEAAFCRIRDLENEAVF